MSGSSHTLRLPAWSGAALAPVVLVAALAHGGQDHLVHGMRYLLPVLAVALPVTLLRRAPLPALALMLGCGFAVTTLLRSWEDGYPRDLRYLVFVMLDVAVGVIAARRPWRISVPAALLVVVAQAGAVAVNPLRTDGWGQSRVLLAMALLIALLIGNAQRQRRGRAEAERAQFAAQAITAERTRIARDLHDMVAHTIGVIAIQAGAGSRVFHTQPATAHEALDAIETTSRETLAGLRRMLDDLRATAPETATGTPPPRPSPGPASTAEPGSAVRPATQPGSGAASTAEPGSGVSSLTEPGSGVSSLTEPGSGLGSLTEPGSGVGSPTAPAHSVGATPAGSTQGAFPPAGTARFAAAGADLGAAPGLANLDRLVDRARRAGLRVEVRRRGPSRPLPADVDLTAYRVVQEAVTNVVRHAATTDCVVTIEQCATELVLDIVDEGRGGTGAGEGYGLIGMRERIGLLDGALTAGPRPEGGFAVNARLPMPVEAR